MTVEPFRAISVSRLAHQLKSEGRSIIHMEVGQPSTPAPAVARAGLKARLDQPLGYTVALGLPELRKGIADLYQRWYGVDLDPARVVVTPGSSGAFMLAFAALFDAGDRVALGEPGYPSYRQILRAMSLQPVGIPTRIEDRYQPRPVIEPVIDLVRDDADAQILRPRGKGREFVAAQHRARGVARRGAAGQQDAVGINGDAVAVVIQARDPGAQVGAFPIAHGVRVQHLMRTDDAIPQVKLDTSVMDAMLELSRTGLGLVAVCDNDRQVKGVFTDGDLRRWLVGGGSLQDIVSQAMTRNGVTLQAESRAIEAKERLMKHKISAAPVVDDNGQLVGAINLQNFYQAGIL